jgi:hypothetical protein
VLEPAVGRSNACHKHRYFGFGSFEEATCTLEQHRRVVGVINIVRCLNARVGQCLQSVGVRHGDSVFPNSGMVRAPYGIPHRPCQVDKALRHYEKDGCGVRIIRELVSGADAFLRRFPVLFGIFWHVSFPDCVGYPTNCRLSRRFHAGTACRRRADNRANVSLSFHVTVR